MKEGLIDSQHNPLAIADVEGGENDDKPTTPKVDTLEVSKGEEGYDEESATWYVTISAMIASINSCNLGYDQGVTTGVVRTFRRDGGNGLRLNDTQIELFVGMLSFAAILGAASMAYLSDKMGRRFIFVLSQVFFITGILVMICSATYEVIMLGRFILGFGVGLGLAVDPMYIAEIAPPRIRGRLVSWSETADNCGILLGFMSSWIFSGADGNKQWRAMLSLGLIMPLVLLFCAAYRLPESPRWLLQNNRQKEAAEILRKCSSNPNAEGHELARVMKADIDEELALSANTTWTSLFSDKISRRKLRAGLGMAIAQQITGEEAIL